MQTHSESNVINSDEKERWEKRDKTMKERLLNRDESSRIMSEIHKIMANNPLPPAKDNKETYDKYINLIQKKLGLVPETTACNKKYNEILGQSEIVINSLTSLKVLKNKLQECLDKSENAAVINAKVSEMQAANNKFKDEFNVLKTKLPLPSYNAIKTKHQAMIKELSTVKPAAGVFDTYLNIYNLQLKSDAHILRAIECEIYLCDHLRHVLTNLQKAAISINQDCEVVCAKAKQRIAEAPAKIGAGTLIQVSPKEKPKSGLEVKTGTSPTESPAGSAQLSPPSSPSSSDNGSNRGSPERPGHSPKMYKPSPDTSPKQQATAAPADPKVGVCCTVV